MKKKNIFNTTSLVLFFLAIVIAVVLYVIFSKNNTVEEKHVKKVTILNKTVLPVEKIVKTAIVDVVGYDSLYIEVLPLPESERNHGSLTLNAYIVKSQVYKKTYTIYISEYLVPTELKSVLLHEIIHIIQYEEGMLTSNQKDRYHIYKKDTIYTDLVPYQLRLYEIDADRLKEHLYIAVDTALYK